MGSDFSFFFFFQAEDGIRDATVTGVQTCALPISRAPIRHAGGGSLVRGTGTARARLSDGARATARAVAALGKATGVGLLRRDLSQASHGVPQVPNHNRASHDQRHGAVLVPARIAREEAVDTSVPRLVDGGIHRLVEMAERFEAIGRVAQGRKIAPGARCAPGATRRSAAPVSASTAQCTTK